MNIKTTLLITLFVLGCNKTDRFSLPASNIPTPVDAESISGSLYCSKVDVGSGVTLTYQYQNATYANGDHIITCSISSSLGEYSHTQLFKPSAPGALNGFCSVGYDVDGLSSGYWIFTSSGGVNKAVYNDVGSAHNNYTYTFAGGDCVNL